MYRQYARDEVVEVYEDDRMFCSVGAKVCDVFWYPMKKPNHEGIPVDGMTIMTSLPTCLPQPKPFVEGSRELLEQVLYQVQNDYSLTHPTVVRDWQTWAEENCPESDDVHEYLRAHGPLDVPLGEVLFSGKPIDDAEIKPQNDSAFSELDRMRSTDCVAWSRWGLSIRDPDSVENNASVEHVPGSNILRRATPARLKPWKPWKQRRKLGTDERGQFKFILQRDTNTDWDAFTKEGQVVDLACGEKVRIHWRGSRKKMEMTKTEFKDLQSEDRIK